MRIHVQRAPHIVALDGDAVYVHNPTYSAATSRQLIATIRHEAMYFDDTGDLHCFSRRVYRHTSNDNGITWTASDDEHTETPEAIEGVQWWPARYILDEHNDVLISLSCSYEVDPNEQFMGIGNRDQRTRKMFYQISLDAGSSWTERRQVIDARPEYDEINWAPGIQHGHTSGIASGQHIFLPDGTLVLGFVASHPDIPEGNPTPRVREHYATTLYARAQLSADRQNLEWQFGDMIKVPFPKSSDGCCEPAVTRVDDGRLFNTMRCQGDEGTGIYTTRYTTISEDGGMTWSDPTPLVYDNGETVWTPASVHRFFVSSKTSKTYLLANILPRPVHSQMPRYPLTIAEFDTERCCVIKDTVSVIQDLPDGAPEERRYTNWGAYEERDTGDLIMMMPEQPKNVNFTDMTKPEDFTADCIRFRIKIDD